MEQIILQTISKNMKDKKVICNIQHQFMKGKSGLTNLMAFSSDMTVSVDEGRRADVVCLSIGKDFDSRLPWHPDRQTDEVWTVRLTGNCPNCQAQRVVVSSMKSRQRPSRVAYSGTTSTVQHCH